MAVQAGLRPASFGDRQRGFAWTGAWLVLCLGLGACAGTGNREADRLSAHAGSSDLAYRLVTELTAIGPRLAGSPQDAKARAWAEQRLRQLGLDAVWTEPVRYPVWERGAARVEVVGDDRRLNVLALGGSRGTPRGGLRAEVLRFRGLDELRAAPADAATGRIVFLDPRTERRRDGSGYGEAVVARVQGAAVAASKGAIAVLVRSIGTDEGTSTPHTGLMRYGDAPMRIPAAALASVDADWLARTLEAGPVTLDLQISARTRRGLYEGANVIGELRGSHRPDEIVLLGAHLDSWDVGSGALDDASGVAITFAAIGMIRELGLQPRRTIRVVAFANEEQGAYGGNAYAATRQQEAKRHVLAMEADLGAGPPYRFSTAYLGSQRAALQPLLTRLAELGVEEGVAEGKSGVDLQPLRALGVRLGDVALEASHYFDYHHTREDTLDKIDPEAIRRTAQVYALIAWTFADERRVRLETAVPAN